jgi:hypothetical protein
LGARLLLDGLLLVALLLARLLLDGLLIVGLLLARLLSDGLLLVGLLLARLLSDGLLLVGLLLARLLSDGLLLIGLLFAGLPFGRSRRLCRCEERQQTKRDPAPHRSIIPITAACAARLILSNDVKRKLAATGGC